MNRNQNGFSAIEGLLIAVIVGVIGFVGWYVWNNSRKTTTNNNTVSTASPAAKPKTTTTTSSPSGVANSNAGYLVIKEWGIKVKLEDADKVTYVMNGTPNGSAANADGIVSYAALSLKDSVTTSADCKPMNTSISQHPTTRNVGEGANMTTVGKYAYSIDGGLNSCDDKTVNTLQGKIFNELLKRDIVAE